MGDRKFTLVELHLDGDTQFGPRTISDLVRGTAGGATEETDEEAAAADEESGGKGKSAAGALIALVVLAGVALAARKFRGGEDEPAIEDREEPEVVVD